MRLARNILLIALLVLQACGESGGETGAENGRAPEVAGPSPTPGGYVIRHLESDCKTLNWVLHTTQYEDYVLRYLYDALLDYDAHLEIKPVLAESFSVSKDHLRITVRLRDGLRWHDGVPITSADVEFTVAKIKDPAVPAVNMSGWFDKLDHVEIIDDKTVDFVWREPYAPSLHALTLLRPIPKHIYGEGDFLTHPANRAPVGSGAFKFQEWKTSQTITLVRNDDYYGDNAYLDKIIFRVIPDRSTALNALKTGELDEMRVRQVQWESLTKDSDFQAKFNEPHYYVPQYNYFAWNCRSVWFNDKRVRRAMTMLLDRQKVIETLYANYSKLVTGPYYINSWAYNHEVEPYPFSPEQAKSLLDETGWVDSDNDGVREKGGVKFSFEFFIVSGSQIASELAQIFQEECGRAGVEVRIRAIEGATFFDKVFKGEYDAAALAWRLDNDPDLFDTFHSSEVPPNGLNHVFYSNSQVDLLLEAGRVEFDQQKRAEIYHAVHRLIHEDQPYTFVNTVPEKRPISKRIGNVVLSPDGPFKFYPGGIYWYIKRDT